MRELKIYNSIGKNLLFLVICLVFVGIGVWMTATAKDTTGRAMGVVGALFFGIGLIVFPKQLLDRRPRVVINDQGIFDRTLKIGVIEWRDITDAYLRSISGSEFVCLVLADDAKYLRQAAGTATSRLASYNKALGFESVNINLSGVGTSGRKVMEIIRAELAKHDV